MKIRRARWQFIYAFLLTMGFACVVYGSSGSYSCETPLSSHTDSSDEREFQNIYQCMSALNAHNVTISTETVTTLTATSANLTGVSISTITSVSSMTVTNLHITGSITGPFTNWASFSLSTNGGWGTTSSKIAYFRRVGDTLEVHGLFVCGTVSGSSGQILLPSGLTIDSSKLITAQTDYLGTIFDLTGSAVPAYANTRAGFIFYDGSTSDRVFFGYKTGGNIFQADLVNNFASNSDFIQFDFRVPISGWSF